MADDLNLPKKRIIKTNASLWKRVLSFLLDFIIVRIIIMSPFSTVMLEKIPTMETFDAYFQFLQTNQELLNSFAPMLITMMFIVFAYFVIFEYRLQQTPGMMMMKLKIEPEKNTKLNFFKILIRNLFALPLGPLIILWIIEPLYLFISKRRLSEILTKTNTIEEIIV